MLRQVAYSKTASLSCRDCDFYHVVTQDAKTVGDTSVLDEFQSLTNKHIEDYKNHRVQMMTISTENVEFTEHGQ